jgi:pyrimidine operon attenuation protein/uracil phosphoribosyltransferase
MGVARQSDLDGRAGRSQRPQHVEPETAAGILASKVVLVDDGVANAEAVEAALEIVLGQAQKRA